MLKVNEIFSSIQGEGRHQGEPAIFLRLSGCTRVCNFEGQGVCDSSYHIKGKIYIIEEVINKLKLIVGDWKLPIIVISGGEPLLQMDMLQLLVIRSPHNWSWHLETNGDLICQENFEHILDYFNYICISPKEIKVAEKISKIKYLCNYQAPNWDIKVVTDLKKCGVNMLQYASMLMPLSTYNKSKDQAIRKKVWEYCVENKLFYSSRLHIDLFGKKRGI